MMRPHLAYPRDGGPVACACEVKHDHDLEDPMSLVNANRVEIDKEHFQQALITLNTALRDMKPALMVMSECLTQLNKSMHHMIESVLDNPADI